MIDDDEDFLVSDNSSQGGHSNLPVGVAVLYGPNGSGKTSSVYALAKDLGYKVSKCPFPNYHNLLSISLKTLLDHCILIKSLSILFTIGFGGQCI